MLLATPFHSLRIVSSISRLIDTVDVCNFLDAMSCICLHSSSLNTFFNTLGFSYMGMKNHIISKNDTNKITSIHFLLYVKNIILQ